MLEKVHRSVFYDRMMMAVFTLYRKCQRNEIIARTFSREKKEWDIKKKSMLIEFLLLNIPIPMIYMTERSGGKIEIVDGQQRLNAIFDFLSSRFPLTGMEILKELEGKKFIDLETVDSSLQRKLEEFPLSLMIIKRESPPGIELEIFKRLNQ
ncbi:MAG: DUF262 domain-containing protein [Acidobacteria bacterium]|jgi:hypothetical protein|nr:DUF262 domain-containing protein [Acidobacteriota bacterium]